MEWRQSTTFQHRVELNGTADRVLFILQRGGVWRHHVCPCEPLARRLSFHVGREIETLRVSGGEKAAKTTCSEPPEHPRDLQVQAQPYLPRLTHQPLSWRLQLRSVHLTLFPPCL